MPLTVAVQMDPIARIKIAGDSTFALLLEAQARGHRLLHYTPDRLRLQGGRVEAMAEPLAVQDVEATVTPASASRPRRPLERRRGAAPAGSAVRPRLRDDDASVERNHPRTLVVNDPRAVRDSPEKLFVMDFPELTPPTLIARDRDAIEAFRREHGDVRD